MDTEMVSRQVSENEKRLLSAIKNNDIAVLDELLHEDLLFMVPDGLIVTKALDLEAHGSGNMNIETISAIEEQVNMIGDTAVVTVIIALKGNIFNQSVSGRFRYIRTWKLFDDKWKIIAGGCIQVQ